MPVDPVEWIGLGFFNPTPRLRHWDVTYDCVYTEREMLFLYLSHTSEQSSSVSLLHTKWGHVPVSLPGRRIQKTHTYTTDPFIVLKKCFEHFFRGFVRKWNVRIFWGRNLYRLHVWRSDKDSSSTRISKVTTRHFIESIFTEFFDLIHFHRIFWSNPFSPNFSLHFCFKFFTFSPLFFRHCWDTIPSP